MSLGLGYDSLNIFLSEVLHTLHQEFSCLCSWCFPCRLPSLGPRTAFLCSLLCSHGTRHLPPDPLPDVSEPPAHLCQDVRRTLPVSSILKSAIIPRLLNWRNLGVSGGAEPTRGLGPKKTKWTNFQASGLVLMLNPFLASALCPRFQRLGWPSYSHTNFPFSMTLWFRVVY